MAFGCFVYIYQQDGTPVRMHYEGLDVNTRRTVEWIGINEQMAQKFKDESKPSQELGNL